MRLLVAGFGLAALFLGAVVFLHMPSVFFTPDIASAQTASANLSGYGWSDTIGWLQMYAVSIGPDATTLQGYGWSENIGWVSFNINDLSGCPSGVCSATIVNGALQGWARACAGTQNGDCTGSSRTDGWDGWISLSGSGYGPSVSGGTNSGTFSGYAWGSDVIGWIDFSNVTIAPTVQPTGSIGTFSATPSRVSPNGGTTLLSWNVSSMAHCTVTGSDGSIPAADTPANGTDGAHSVSANVISITRYTLTCIDGNGTSSSVSVQVTLLPKYKEL